VYLTRVKQKGYCSRVRDFRGSYRRKAFRGFLYLFVAQILEEIRGWGAPDEHLRLSLNFPVCKCTDRYTTVLDRRDRRSQRSDTHCGPHKVAHKVAQKVAHQVAQKGAHQVAQKVARQVAQRVAHQVAKGFPHQVALTVAHQVAQKAAH
jgi:hypothetical protein